MGQRQRQGTHRAAVVGEARKGALRVQHATRGTVVVATMNAAAAGDANSQPLTCAARHADEEAVAPLAQRRRGVKLLPGCC
jgi:hypothetical protein